MLQLPKGNFFGSHHQVLNLPRMVITDTEYTKEKVDWHYHQHPYFTFLLQGSMLEVNKSKAHECSVGTLLYHHWQDAHYNIKGKGYVQGFHVELDAGFFEQYGLPAAPAEGSSRLEDPVMKTLFRKLYLETKKNDVIVPLGVDALLLQVFERLKGQNRPLPLRTPPWVKKVKAALYDMPVDSLTYDALAAIAGIHPVHLSRSFPRYFHTTVGQYLRNLQMEKAAHLLSQTGLSLTAISYQCNYSDQSHFIRSFKQEWGITPLQYRKLLKRG
jgi:AraC family transcriptional regulator